MSAVPFPATELPASSAIDELIGTETADGIMRTRKTPMSALIMRILAESPVGVGLTPFGAETETGLAAHNGAAAGTPAHVLLDPDPDRNGIYLSNGATFDFLRGFPDSIGILTSIGGTANARTASLPAWVNPTTVRLYIMQVPAANTGPVTVSVNGEVPRQVLSVAGGALEDGDFAATVMFAPSGNNYRMVHDINAAIRAVNAAMTATEKATTSAAMAAEALAFRDQAAGIVEAAIANRFADTYADADAAKGAWADGDIAAVWADENNDGQLVFYNLDTGALVERHNTDIFGRSRDPFGLGYARPNIARWTRTMFPGDVGAGTGEAITAAQRATRLNALIAKAGIEGKEIVIDQADVPYDYDDRIRLNGISNLVVHLEGDLRNVRDTDPELFGGQQHCCFELGNQHPSNWVLNATASPVMTWFTCGSPAMGADQVTLDDSGSNRADGLAALSEGDVVYVKSLEYGLTGNGQARPEYMLTAKIADIDAGTGTISLDRAFDEAVTDASITLASNDGTTNSTVVDTLGNPVYIAAGITIKGPGKLTSLYGSPFARTASLDLKLEIGELSGLNGIFGNMWAFADILVHDLRVTRKLMDIAGNTHGARIVVNRGEMIGAGDGVPLIAMAENGRNTLIKTGTIIAGQFAETNKEILLLSTVRGITFENDYMFAPALGGGSAIRLANPGATPVDNEVQGMTQDIVLRFGKAVFGSALDYFVNFNDAGGENMRNRLERGRFFGTPTSNAMNLAGTGHTVGKDVYFENGALAVDEDAVDLTAVGCNIPDGVSVGGSASLAQHAISGIQTTSARLLKQANVLSTGTDTTSTTTPNDPYMSCTIPAGALEVGDRIHFEISGQLIGTAGNKNVKITDGTNTATLQTTGEGAFALVGEFVVLSTTAYALNILKTVGETYVKRQRIGENAYSLGDAVTLTVQRHVANAADSIKIENVRFTPHRPGYAVT